FADGAWLKTNASARINNPLWRGQFGDHQNDNFNTSNRLALTAKFLKHFSFEVSGAFNLNQNNQSNWSPTRIDRDWEGRVIIQNDLNQLSNTYNIFYRLQYENVLRYARQFGKHNVSALAGYTQLYDKYDEFSGSLQGFPSNSVQEFNGGGTVNPSLSGGANEVALRSFFGRFNYNYDDRFLFEFNGRRDGSSRFGPNNRFGVFPSLSVGWNLKNEKFMKWAKSVTLLKFRGSWGLSGNDRIANYIWERNYSINDYVVGGVIVPSVALTTLANPTIAWEGNEQLNIGFDLAMFNNKFNLSGEYFSRKSTDVLYANFPVPRTLGVDNLAAQNAAAMLNEGFELNAGYRQNFGALKMTVSGNVTWMADNEVTGLGETGAETIGGNTIIRKGQPFNAYFGYRKIGIFQTAEEVAAAPRQFGSVLTRPGDIRYADISGIDGKPDGIIDARDRVVIGNPYPRWMFGFNLGLEFKGLDLNAVFQGVSRVDRIFSTNGQLPMTSDQLNVLSYHVNRWTPDKPSTTLPRLGGVNNAQFSDFYLEDASYLRLRSLELGYTLPASISTKAKIQRFRIFVSAQNLLTFTKLENFDPERSAATQSDRNAPLYQVFSTGVNLKF
ncbi:MAG: SusC/RagA family TonB-linked outer membrane protein, partial [Bacteroidetes bacterium]